MKNATTIFGLSPEQFFEKLWRATNVYRKARGESSSYGWGHEEYTQEQLLSSEKRMHVEHITVTLFDDNKEEILVDFRMTANRLKEEETTGRLYRDYLVILESGDKEHFHTGNALYFREYQDEDVETQMKREIDNWKRVFSTSLTSANINHYKNLVRDLRASQELFKDNVYAMMDTYLK